MIKEVIKADGSVENGDGYLQSSESEWDSDFVVDDVVELEGEED